MRYLAALSLLALLCSGCSRISLLNKHDYQKSQLAFLKGDTAGALWEFPSEDEKGDFITTIEKGYLSLIQGQPEIEGLKKQATALENKVRFHASPEWQIFVYAQAPEGWRAMYG